MSGDEKMDNKVINEIKELLNQIEGYIKDIETIKDVIKNKSKNEMCELYYYEKGYQLHISLNDKIMLNVLKASFLDYKSLVHQASNKFNKLATETMDSCLEGINVEELKCRD